MLRRPAASAARICPEAFKVCAGEIGIGRFFVKVMQATADNYEATDFFWLSFAAGDRDHPALHLTTGRSCSGEAPK
jgi:hypothetical protein